MSLTSYITIIIKVLNELILYYVVNNQRYAGDVGPRILNFYSEEYFEIDYPLPKQDMAAIPDFAAGILFVFSVIKLYRAQLR